VEIQFVLKREMLFPLYLNKQPVQLAAKGTDRFACMFIFSSPLWPVRLKNTGTHGVSLCGDRLQDSKYLWEVWRGDS
jgi:hypothetical protein